MEDKKQEDIDLAIHDSTGAFLMLDKKERRLLKELIYVTMSSKNARKYISDKLGEEYIEIGNNLYKVMGGK